MRKLIYILLFLPMLAEGQIIGAWTMENTANDLSGNGYNGTNYSATYVAGKYGKGISYSGTSSYTDLGNTILTAGTDIITVSFWFNSTSSAEKFIIDKSSTGYNYPLEVSHQSATTNLLQWQSGRFYYAPNDYNAKLNTIATATGSWWYVVLVGTSTTKAFYIDGKLDISYNNYGGVKADNTTNLNFGRRADATYYFTGILDEILIGVNAWTASAIKNKYSYYKGLY